jgi:hypothetical protein
MTNSLSAWEHQVEMVRMDNELRRREQELTPEQRREDAERRLQELEVQAAEREQEAERE